MAFETILLDIHGKVGLITLNRPQALNALNAQIVGEINQAGFDDEDFWHGVSLWRAVWQRTARLNPRRAGACFLPGLSGCQCVLHGGE